MGYASTRRRKEMGTSLWTGLGLRSFPVFWTDIFLYDYLRTFHFNIL